MTHGEGKKIFYFRNANRFSRVFTISSLQRPYLPSPGPPNWAMKPDVSNIEIGKREAEERERQLRDREERERLRREREEKERQRERDREREEKLKKEGKKLNTIRNFKIECTFHKRLCGGA